MKQRLQVRDITFVAIICLFLIYSFLVNAGRTLALPNSSDGNLSPHSGAENSSFLKNTSNASSASKGDFPDPLSSVSQDFFEEYTLEDFLGPEGVANAQPELPQPETPPQEEQRMNESILVNRTDEKDIEPPLNKLLLNLTVNTTAMPPRIIGRSTFVDKSLLFPQFLPNIQPDAGLFANCDLAYTNLSSFNASLPRGSSVVLYVSALSPSFKCPRSPNLDLEIAYRLINIGVAEVYPDGRSHACRAPWYSPSLGQSGISVVRTPFSVQRVLVQPGFANKVVRGTIVVPVRTGSETNFNHFSYASPRAVYLEAFRGPTGDYVAMEFTLVRCVEGRGNLSQRLHNSTLQTASDDIPEPSLFRKARCYLASWFGSDYESCLYR